MTSRTYHSTDPPVDGTVTTTFKKLRGSDAPLGQVVPGIDSFSCGARINEPLPELLAPRVHPFR